MNRSRLALVAHRPVDDDDVVDDKNVMHNAMQTGHKMTRSDDDETWHRDRARASVDAYG